MANLILLEGEWMTNIVWRWLCNAIALLLVAYLLPSIYLDGTGAALVAALLLGIVNAVIRPVCLFFSFPINFLTLGLFTFVVNAGMLKIVDLLMTGFATGGFWATVLAAILLSIISSILTSVLGGTRRGMF